MQTVLNHSREDTKALHPAPHRDAVTISRKLEEQAKLRIAQQRTTQTPSQINEQVVQLPLWDDTARGVPNAVLRAALFGVISKGPKGPRPKDKATNKHAALPVEGKKGLARPYLERQVIHALKSVRIIYTGVQLDQGDLDVWQTVLHIAYIQSKGDECRATVCQLLKKLGKTDTGKNRNALDCRLSRMNATALDVKVREEKKDRELVEYSYEGSLIDEVYRTNEGAGLYVIRLNPKLRNLFAPTLFTKLDLAVRRQLEGKPLAQWLHGFYSSHTGAYDLKVSELLRWAGCENSSPRSGRQNILKALEALKIASGSSDRRFCYELSDDKVRAYMLPSRKMQKAGKS